MYLISIRVFVNTIITIEVVKSIVFRVADGNIKGFYFVKAILQPNNISAQGRQLLTVYSNQCAVTVELVAERFFSWKNVVDGACTDF